MPCRSDYPDLTDIESKLSIIFCINDDLRGIYKFQLPHPKISDINCDLERLDAETDKLCSILQTKTRARINNYNPVTQRWWINHQISDYKRLILERDSNPDHGSYTPYENRLFLGKTFFNEILEDSWEKIKLRFESHVQGGNSVREKFINERCFVQALAAFELFSELFFLKTRKEEIQDPLIFKEYDKSEAFWEFTLGASFKNWISEKDQTALRTYFDKYTQVIPMEQTAKNYFEVIKYKNDDVLLSEDESLDLIRILRTIKIKILEKL